VATVANLANMLYGASAFNQDISSWNVASVTTLSETFYSASAFNQNIGSWNTASVATMYQACSFCGLVP
jgi:surface protein